MHLRTKGIAVFELFHRVAHTDVQVFCAVYVETYVYQRFILRALIGSWKITSVFVSSC